MIRNTFQFLDKVRLGTEQQWWKLGITDWDNFLKTATIKLVPTLKNIITDKFKRPRKLC